MNCYDCNECLREDETTHLPTDEGSQPFCATCTDMREWTEEVLTELPDVSDDDIFDHYRFPRS